MHINQNLTNGRSCIQLQKGKYQQNHGDEKQIKQKKKKKHNRLVKENYAS